MSHFKRDCLPIVAAAQSSVDHWQDVALFVVGTIQQQFSVMPVIIADIRALGVDSRFLFGSKRESYRYLQANREALWNKARVCHAGQITLDRLIFEYLAVPGIGLAKASFLSQLTTGQGACLDTHNLTRLGITAFRSVNALKPQTVLHKIESYNAAWRAHGTSESFWNQWCDYLAAKLPRTYQDGAHVSRLHRAAIKESYWNT